jgi:UDPglucose 6-dehydrogenase
MKRVCVLGTGYVGLVTGACFAELGNNVICVDTDNHKIELLRKGQVPFYEPGLAELVLRNVHDGRLSFASEPAAGIAESEVVFIAVGTPTGRDGHADLRFVRRAARDIADALHGPKIIVNKSTVPVETGDLVHEIICEHRAGAHDFSVVSNPEFLREGSAIFDFMNPDRIVLGVSDKRAEAFMRGMYEPLNAPIIVTDVRTAEMIKYTANAFLATKISFINEIASICEAVGADIKNVVEGTGSDKRIGKAFMNAGLGFGGSCFPKDVQALVKIAHHHTLAPDILESVLTVNRRQIDRTASRIANALGGLKKKRIGVLGLAFKANTDDVRESPAIALIEALLRAGAEVIAHDPAARRTAAEQLDETILYAQQPLEAARDADAIVVATDWNEYKQLNLPTLRSAMRGNLLVDARNIYDPSQVAEAGLMYLGIGRSARQSTPLLGESRVMEA